VANTCCHGDLKEKLLYILSFLTLLGWLLHLTLGTKSPKSEASFYKIIFFILYHLDFILHL